MHGYFTDTRYTNTVTGKCKIDVIVSYKARHLVILKSSINKIHLEPAALPRSTVVVGRNVDHYRVSPDNSRFQLGRRVFEMERTSGGGQPDVGLSKISRSIVLTDRGWRH